MGQVLLLQCLINQQVQSQERASTIGHVCAWVDREERIPTGTGGVGAEAEAAADGRPSSYKCRRLCYTAGQPST